MVSEHEVECPFEDIHDGSVHGSDQKSELVTPVFTKLCTRSHTKIRYTVSVVCTWMVQWEDNVMVVVDI
jgi:hypothetical protein